MTIFLLRGVVTTRESLLMQHLDRRRRRVIIAVALGGAVTTATAALAPLGSAASFWNRRGCIRNPCTPICAGYFPGAVCAGCGRIKAQPIR